MTTDYHDPEKPKDHVLQYIKDNFIYDSYTGIISGSTNKPVGGLSAGYLQIKFTIDRVKHRHYAHHIAWFLYHGEWPSKTIDHKDRNRSNNKITNLVVSTMGGQAANRPKRQHDLEYENMSRYGKGIYYRKGRYEVYIVREKVRQYLGVFKTIESAQEAIDEFDIKN